MTSKSRSPISCFSISNASKMRAYTPPTYASFKMKVAMKVTIFSGRDTKNEFWEWLFQPQHAKTTFVAHNLQAYDGYFILQYLYNQGIAPELITCGAKIISLAVSLFYPNENWPQRSWKKDISLIFLTARKIKIMWGQCRMSSIMTQTVWVSTSFHL